MAHRHDEQGALDDGGDGRPSKSALKREMTARQALGERLCTLTSRELEQIPLQPDSALHVAVLQSRSISSNSARRRHMQYIGKLMRDVDPEPLTAALEQLHAAHAAESAALHTLEALRDDLVQRGDTAINEVVARWPQADRQLLRQLLRQHGREQATGKPPAAARRLFRYLRELSGSSGVESAD
ncbi:ribosome biogenesis factor YjgA [Chromatocurvus halotolerans]|uniref:Dual-action ribosomal maturation protein DarP n=1 Tax=Chromatocurvus halotolerans TaxID=1132028 RepID=A0A4R2LAE8_9GAMM|nr:ribosome biogenesis factor YjgA [Chromatocurvus halotolerans]TCO76235.1 ribosome-associated protein [Chromatocurvus halotolerans]